MIIEKYIKQTSGFTFIELIVVISIISLLSVNSIFYFNDFIWKQELSYDISQLESNINDLDLEIKNQKSFDYSLYFEKGSYWYTISQNNIWNDIKQEITFDTITWSGMINLSPALIDIWEIKIYKWHKKIQQFIQNWSESIDIKVDDTMEILWTFSWSTLNSLRLAFFDIDKETEIKNTFILDILDKNLVSQNSLTIENISWSKIYNWNNTTLEKPIYIVFEKNWIESTLELN